jgi:hypothetical protein
MDMVAIIKSALLQIISSLLRTVLLAGVTWLTTRNLINDDTATQLTALIPAVLAAVIWSFIEKYIIAKLHLSRLLVALSLPANSSLEDVKNAVNGKGAR